MGVVYRLTPDISAFIISEKKKDPKATCQHLSGRVFLQFGQQVSKSSVHALLKQHQIITPRARKIKDTFKIPLDKKNQISKALAPFASAIGKEEPDTNLVDLRSRAGEIFLTAALGDLSFKSTLGIKDASEIVNFKEENKSQWAYLTQEVAAIKIQSGGRAFYIDPRFQGLHAGNPSQAFLSAPIERAIGEATDKILNNIEPLIIRLYPLDDLNPILYYFLEAFENKADKAIESISLIDAKGREYVSFNDPPRYQRYFIMGIPLEHKELQWVTKDSPDEFPWPDKDFNVKVIKKDNQIIITNLLSKSYDEIVRFYEKRHPKGVYQGFAAPKEGFVPDAIDVSYWLQQRLKQRAGAFFSAQVSVGIVDKAIELQGYDEEKEGERRVFLQVPDNCADKEIFIKACQLINSMDIKDGWSRKLQIFINECRQ